MTTPNPARVVFDEMNRDPGKFYPMETCALAVQIVSSRVIIPVDMPSLVTHIEDMETGDETMKFSKLDIGHIGLRPNGTEFKVVGIDDADETVMDEFGTWYAFADCDFPAYEE